MEKKQKNTLLGRDSKVENITKFLKEIEIFEDTKPMDSWLDQAGSDQCLESQIAQP